MTSRTDVAAMIDHTLLKPESTPADVAALVAEAQALGVKAICVSPSALPVADTGDLVVATVCGFPSGGHHSEIKAAEAARAVADGADEVDMVINLGAAKAGDFDAVESDIRAVVAAAGSALVKVIIESAALTDEEIVEACRRAERAGAGFVKTSTGFHPSGGASAQAVRLMRATVGGRLGVKASGGIRTAQAAEEMIRAGASRLGLSGSRVVLDGLA
ncbi:deoxyribose-phosphate aldolase [Brevibacterium daeguense]|uniref:Deoxyribose-phosphate aldolase n=1 Tax=Brevibacterium daeguense TaxID=909936 RepID=A0ABP8EFZ1_9MICO|nr:deoxyribose-phosphate aldolase [Brevibacterium daeguense]